MPLHDFEQKAVENCDDRYTYNHTELYQLCRLAGRSVRPSDATTTLVSVLEGQCTGTVENPLDKIRDGLMNFLLDHWKRVHSQLLCPAKSGDPKACYGCCDAQVIHCLVSNPKVEAEIERTEKMDQTNISVHYDINSAPRSVEGLKALKGLRLRTLAIEVGVCPTAESRSAFVAMSVDDQAKTIAEFLRAHDAAAAPAKELAPPPPPPPPPQAQAESTPAPSTVEPPKRNPRGRPPANRQQEALSVAPSETVEAPAPAVAQVIEALGKKLEDKMDSMNARITDLAAQVNNLLISKRWTDSEAQQLTATAVTLLMAQEITQMSRDEILQMALDDVPSIKEAVGKALA